jgi:hypothetical protein
MKISQGITSSEDGACIICGLLYLAHKLCYIDMYLHMAHFPLVKFPLLWPFKTCCITHTNLTVLFSQTFVFINLNLWAIFTTCLQKFCVPPMGCARHTGYNVGTFLFGKCNGKWLFRRPGHRWENITKDVLLNYYKGCYRNGCEEENCLRTRSREHCYKCSCSVSNFFST